MTGRQTKAALALYRAQQEFNAAFADDEPDRDLRWRKLLTMVEAAGGTVTGEDWRDMGRACKYHPSGLGGFYVGGNPTMVRNADDSRTLTKQGVAVLDQHGRA
jgi:hypothetical protein